MRKVLVVQHVEVEGPGLLGDVLEEHGLELELIGPLDAIPTYALEDSAGVVVMGGPMGVYETDEHPRLLDELALLRAAVARDVPVFGICLGSQLLAAALGARVYPGPRKEIGWFEVMLEEAAGEDALFSALPSSFTALHWHGDVFDLPSAARLLARSALTARQAFAVGRAWGVLFHLEANVAQTVAMARAFRDELAGAGVSAESVITGAERHASGAAALGRAVFTRWVALLDD